MRVKLICIGNELLLDDGVGPAAARYIESRYCLPENVTVANCACMGMAVISDLRDCDYALVLDAVDVPGARPGQVFSFEPDDAAPTPPGATSLHDMRFADVLHSASLLGIESGGRCFGIQVENRDPSEFIVGLSPRVAAAVPFLAQAAVRHVVDVLGIGGIVDVAATLDPYRAGRGYCGERDFSREGARARGPEIPVEEVSAWRPPVSPVVFGEPTAEYAADYLEKSLEAVGVAGVGRARADEGGRLGVGWTLPTCDETEALASRFGVELRDAQRGSGECACLAFVGPQTTDYDLDALIGACFEVVEGGRM